MNGCNTTGALRDCFPGNPWTQYDKPVSRYAAFKIMPSEFEPVFQGLREILKKHAGVLEVSEDSATRYCLAGAVGPATVRAWGGKMKRKTMPVARKSLVAARPIATGEPFTRENLAVKRPGTGLEPNLLWDLLDRPAQRKYALDDSIDEIL